jgi:hypothetical protein
MASCRAAPLGVQPPHGGEQKRHAGDDQQNRHQTELEAQELPHAAQDKKKTHNDPETLDGETEVLAC